MGERAMKDERDGGTDGSRHEGAAAPSEDLVDRQDSPQKRHGDALRDGTGTRHGLREENEEPGTAG